MHRFYIPSQNIQGTSAELVDKAQAHYIRDVLRLKLNEAVEVFDEKGNEYACRIQSIEESKIIFALQQRLPAKTSMTKITVACAIPKKAKFDDIVDKLTQLGVDRVIPLKTERVIVKLDKIKEMLRLERWKKIALSASQQSKRNSLPVIAPPQDILEVIRTAKNFDLKLIPTLLGERKSLKGALAGTHPKNTLILIGPEGDFSDGEVKLALDSGFIPVTLGNSVLRVDTAAIAAASFLKLFLEKEPV